MEEKSRTEIDTARSKQKMEYLKRGIATYIYKKQVTAA